MDTFAHVAAGVLIGTKKSSQKKWYYDSKIYAAILFAAIPDLCSFGIFMVQRALQGDFWKTRPELWDIPSYVYVNYNLGHSLIFAGLIGMWIFMFHRSFFRPFLAWPFHILCDIPTHGIKFFATPFLYPFSDYKFDGWSFGKNSAIIVGYWAIIIIFILIRVYKDRVKN